ncbi:hypothetical protein GCM10010228_83270 [Streptomyces massasporeus]|nr:hypothetical protein GCM10010228_83270 [Streptomyces massasporeus]
MVRADHLKSGHTASCGCIPSGPPKRPGLRADPLYSRWRGMIARTTDRKHPRYADYGGRGIVVCERWKTFAAFAADMGTSFSEELTLERIDNDRGYEPGNCRWATLIEQARNKRSSRFVTFRGQTRTIAEWAELLGLNYDTVHGRLSKQGWSVERTLTTGVDPEIIALLCDPATDEAA